MSVLSDENMYATPWLAGIAGLGLCFAVFFLCCLSPCLSPTFGLVRVDEFSELRDVALLLCIDGLMGD